jgi:hypothetical protein
MAAALLQMVGAATVQIDATTRYVTTTGSDSSNDCSNPDSPCATIQHAIDQSNWGDFIHIGGGTFTRVGTVAEITKSVFIVGGHSPDFSGHDPDMYRTVLDAQWGGSVISITNAGEVLVDFLTITHGDGTGNPCVEGYGGCGGGIFAKQTALYVGHSLITDNVGTTSSNAAGGGIYLNNRNGAASAELWENRIVSNTASTASTGWGGGLYIEAGNDIAPPRVVTNTFQTNTASSGADGYGGGMYLLSYATIRNNIFDGNAATSGGAGGYGGGLYMWEVWDATMEANRFQDNEASGSSEGHGGAIYASARAYFTMANNLLARNKSSGAGDGLWLRTWNPTYIISGTLVNNTLADNHASGASEGIWAGSYVSLTLKNNIIAGHTTGITNTAPASSTIAADTNLFWNTSDPVVGSNPISQDPHFMPGYGYHLHHESPAIDAGLTISWLTADLDGRPRPQESDYDIGAYEGGWWDVRLPLVLRKY